MTNFQDLAKTVEHLHGLAPEAFMPIQNDDDLKRVTGFLRALDRQIGEEFGHALAPLADVVMTRVMAYEETHTPIPPVNGAQMLAFLMDSRPITQQELATATGIAQSTISQLLNERRQFTADHARKFSELFKVNPGLFL